MTQDTRKDRRAKIVSLNVRYKSATVDEFIDNHSHDVSKGGLFIKTSSPFPPGTLLKFEIRIAGDKAVIAGVGRVVWKRETSQAGPEVPAGMGVKFIKIDDASRAVIDKLVDSRGEARNAYDEGVGDAGAQEAPPPPEAPPPTPAPAPAVAKAGPIGLSSLTRDPKPPVAAAAAPAVAARAQPVVPFRPAPSASKIPVAAGKATMMGLGSIQEAMSAAAKAGASGPAAGRPAGEDSRSKGAPTAGRLPPSTAAAASSAPSTSPMFPKSNSEAEMPPKNEQTVMKQAAELLEEALRGAGGSMEEIGQNPLFELAKQESAPATAKDKVVSGQASSSALAPPTPLGLGPRGSKASEESGSNEAATAEVSFGEKEAAPPAQPAASLASGMASRHGALESTARSATHDDPPLAAKARPAPEKPKVAPVERPRSATSALEEEEAPKNKWLVPVLAVAGAGVLGFLFYTQVYAPGQDTPPEPTPPASVATSSAPPPSASAAPAVASAPSALPSASAASEAPSAAASTSLPADAAVTASEAAVAAKPVAPVAPWRPPPKPTPPPPAEKPSAPASTDGTAPGTATPPADTATTPSTPPPAPKATAKPAGKKPDDDNPY
jgi:uncharacterized protein (TIGR02266 family)